MALFTLTDIQFKSQNRQSTAQQNLVSNKYKTNTLRYPLDLGELDKGHYMVLHINEQVRTQFPGVPSGDEVTAHLQRNDLNQSNGGAADIGGIYSNAAIELKEAVDKIIASNEVVRKAGTVAGPVLNDVGKYLTSNLNSFNKTGFRTVRRTTDTIALYMPDTLAFSQSQNYTGLELGGGNAALIGAGISGISKFISSDASLSDRVGEGLKNATPFVLNAIANLTGNAGRALFAGFTGTTVNPMMEVIYSSPEFRSFRFDFMFYPRTRIEAKEVQNIIQRIQFHQAPEVLGNNSAGGLGGYFLVPPSEFDIEFYYNGTVNPNIPKVSTCVLSTIDVDYAPNGFAAYEVFEENGIPKKGGTGMPVGIRMGLVFKETRIMTKQEINKQNTDGRSFYSQAERSSLMNLDE
jgi:hypothetical protein